MLGPSHAGHADCHKGLCAPLGPPCRLDQLLKDPSMLRFPVLSFTPRLRLNIGGLFAVVMALSVTPLAQSQQDPAPTAASAKSRAASAAAGRSTTKPAPPRSDAASGARRAGGRHDRDSRSPPTERDERGPTGTGTGTGNNMGPT